MSALLNLTQLLLIIVVVINTILAFYVYRINKKSATNIIFLLLSIVTSFWLVIIYESTTPTNNALTLLYTRLTVFAAVPQSVLFFLLAHTIPSPTLALSRKRFFTLIFATLSIMGLTLTPYVFKEVRFDGETIHSVVGWGMPFFAIFTSTFSIAAIYTLFKKIRSSTGDLRNQLMFMLRGVLLMLGLIITTIMIPVILFENQTFIAFSPLYALIFLGATAVAIVRYHLFDLKVIATEAFAFILSVMLLSRLLVSTTSADRLINAIIFLATVVFGILLVRSVRNEVRQREQLEILTKQLEKANEQLKALDKARADFITIASHQLRTPPATIKWYLSAVLSGDFGDLPREAREQIEKAQVTNNSLISLIDDLLNASRIERGKMEFFFEQANLAAVTQSVFDQLLPLAKMKNLDLIYHKPQQELPEIIMDREKVRQVINNFIDNAIKYTKEGTVTINLGIDKDSLRLSVTDTGKGIAPDVALSIFEKYTRGKDSVTHSTGLGLGLYVAKIIIEQHNGKIWAESPGVGLGSSFIFTLPLHNDLKATTFDLAEQPHDDTRNPHQTTQA